MTVNVILAPTSVTSAKRQRPLHRVCARRNPRAPRIGRRDCLIRYVRAAGGLFPSVPGALKLNAILLRDRALALNPVTRPGVRPCTLTHARSSRERCRLT